MCLFFCRMRWNPIQTRLISPASNETTTKMLQTYQTGVCKDCGKADLVEVSSETLPYDTNLKAEDFLSPHMETLPYANDN